MTLHCHLFAHSPEAAKALGEVVQQSLSQRLCVAPRALLLVSGGRSPIALFDELSALAVRWSDVDISLVDERCVAPTHTDANAVLVRRHLLVGPAAAARWLPLIDDRILAAGDALHVAQMAAAAANRNPLLADATTIILGFGLDGHTASLFSDAPQWQAAQQTSERYVALLPESAAHARVSLSLPALIGQQTCLVWSQGATKRATLQRLTAAVREFELGVLSHDQLAQLGPLALLIAHPAVALHVFHSDD